MTELDYSLGLQMDTLQNQEMTFGEGGRAVYEGLEVPDNAYGIRDMVTYEATVNDSLRYASNTLLVKRALPNSGKSIVIGQEADRMYSYIQERRIRKRMLYLGWGPFLLSVVGDPSRFGHINHLLPEVSRKFSNAVEQIMELEDVAAIVEIPVGRGDEAVKTAVEGYGIIHSVYADEFMRRERLAFRQAVQQITLVKDLPPLLKQYNIRPFTVNGRITKTTLEYFKRNGATVDGVIAVDRDVNEAMAPLLRERVIAGLPGFYEGNIFPGETRNGDTAVADILEGSPHVRTEAVRNYLDYQNEVVYQIPREHTLLTFNPPTDDTKDLRQDLLEHCAIPLIPGGELDLTRWKSRRKIYFTP